MYTSYDGLTYLKSTMKIKDYILHKFLACGYFLWTRSGLKSFHLNVDKSKETDIMIWYICIWMTFDMKIVTKGK